MKALLSWNFVITLIISFLVFEGIEHLLHELFDINLSHLLSLGGVGTVVFLGFKFHILCCAIPSVASAIYCTHKNKKHCNHNHGSK